MKRHLSIGIAVLVTWLVAMGLLLERELGGRRLEAPATDPLATSQTWLGVYLADGPRVGHVHLHRQPETRDDLPGVRFTMDVQMALELLGRDTDLHLAGVLWRASEAELAEIDVTVDSVEQTLRLRGRLEDGELRAEVESAGERFPLRLPMEADVLLTSGFGASLGLPALEVGDDVRLPSFDPLTLRRGTARLRCEAEEVLEIGGEKLLTRRLRVETGGMSSRAWIDEAGEVVRAETPVGLVLERLDPAALATSEATAAARGEPGAAGLLERTAIVPTGRQPFRGARLLLARASLKDPESHSLALPSDDVQRATPDGRLRLDAEGGGPGSGRVDSRELLASDPFVQSDHPRLVARARSITEGLESAEEKALAIYRWVYENVEKVPVMSLPSALEVLETRRGDCNEHTVLYAALARAVGLPTRIAVGVVWSDELGGFYYHAWPEVLIDGRFRRLDPTLGQEVADATHVKLLEGGIESWPRLLPYLGQLELEILEVR